MHPETRLFVDAVAIHRELVPLLAGLPDHRRRIREAFGTPEGDLDFLRARFREIEHPGLPDIEAAALFAWLPAGALPECSP